MRSLPDALMEALEERLGARVRDAAALGGGMVARAARVETSGGPVFVKWKEDAPPRWFACEADGLDRLRATGAVRTPRPLAWQDAEGGAFPFLALEWVEVRPPREPEQASRRLGEELAALHRTRPPFGAFGLEMDNFLGAQPQVNTPTPRWPDFYRDHRLLPQMERARSLGLMPARRERLLEQVIGRLDDLLAGGETEPALIHGDLWGGNLLTAGDDPVLIDPAVYYADREMELAYMQLFSGFPRAVFDAYEAAYPLAPGYARRRPIHQLYPLLIHVNHFGEQYGPPLEAACYGALGRQP